MIGREDVMRLQISITSTVQTTDAIQVRQLRHDVSKKSALKEKRKQDRFKLDIIRTSHRGKNRFGNTEVVSGPFVEAVHDLLLLSDLNGSRHRRC